MPADKYWYRRLRSEKERIAKEKGVLAVIEVSVGSDYMLNWADNVPFNVKSSHYEGPKKDEPYKRLAIAGESMGNRIPMVSLSQRAINSLLTGSGIDLIEYEQKAARLVKQKAVRLNTSIQLKTTVHSRIIKARNVIGIIEGKTKDEFIVIGAHYDHLGVKNGFIYNGADDNASGTVGVMSVAKAFMATGEKPEKSIIFAAWTGEEKGLLGSRYFANNPPTEISSIKYYHNLDMIGRDVNDEEGVKCHFTYSSSIKQIKTMCDENISDYKLNLQLNYSEREKPSGGSDHSSFSAKGIPVSIMITGIHDEYHKPNDEVSKINYSKMLRLVQLCYLNMWHMANEPF